MMDSTETGEAPSVAMGDGGIAQGRLIIVGDVHGCLQELRQLMERIEPAVEDRIIFIGDLIDKGPDSVGVVRFVMELAKSRRVELILGNHEEKFLRYVRHCREGDGKELQMQGTESYPVLMESLTKEELRWLEGAYYSLHLPEQNLLLVHAGIPHQVHFPLPATYRYGIHSPKEFKGLELLTLTRYLNPEGQFVSLRHETPQDIFWAESYDGRYGHMVFGHQPFPDDPAPRRFPHATGIDTGCVQGGRLSAILFNDRGMMKYLHN